MNIEKKIKREKRQLKKFNKLRKVGVILTIIGSIIFTFSSIWNLVRLVDKVNGGATQFGILIAIIFFIIKELWASNLFKIGLFMLIMFSTFVNKKKLNIERFEKELVQSVVAESEVIDIK